MEPKMLYGGLLSAFPIQALRRLTRARSNFEAVLGVGKRIGSWVAS